MLHDILTHLKNLLNLYRLFCQNGQTRTWQKRYGSDWIRIHNIGPEGRVTEASYLQRTPVHN
jgi:hypothetical protein